MDFFHLFYVQSMDMVFLEMALMFAFWTLFMTLLTKKVKRFTGAVFALISVIGVVMVTVLRRSDFSSYEISLIPFHTFADAQYEIELLRTMAMNVFLFMPLGMSLPFALGDRIKHKLIFTVAFGLVLSSSVELTQLLMSRGMCDIDDVICNTLGAFLGYLSYAISRKITDFMTKHKENRGKEL